ncbi:MAG: helix-hairpin-helix domain-containing protein [Acidobacteria bacterium]|jgi:DNA polymerase (family 10)|nr:helix-hairpin-helix domain-containing protein [Acidobacteriota bacterium]
MTNQEIARAFDKVAFFLALKDENEFKINAYAKAAKSIRELPVPVEDLLLAGEDLTKIDGIGKVLAQKVEDLVIIGSLKILDELLAEFPDSLYEMSQIKGVGPRTILKIFATHRIRSLDELKHFLERGDKLAVPAPYECRIREFLKK